MNNHFIYVALHIYKTETTSKTLATGTTIVLAYNLLQNAAVAVEGKLPLSRYRNSYCSWLKGEKVHTPEIDDGEWLSKGF